MSKRKPIRFKGRKAVFSNLAKCAVGISARYYAYPGHWFKLWTGKDLSKQSLKVQKAFRMAVAAEKVGKTSHINQVRLS